MRTLIEKREEYTHRYTIDFQKAFNTAEPLSVLRYLAKAIVDSRYIRIIDNICEEGSKLT